MDSSKHLVLVIKTKQGIISEWPFSVQAPKAYGSIQSWMRAIELLYNVQVIGINY